MASWREGGDDSPLDGDRTAGREAETTDDPSRAALAFLIALDEAPSDAGLHARLAAWRAADPAHEAAWGEIRSVDALVGAVAQDLSRGTVRPTRPARPARRRAMVGALAAAAMLLVAVLIPWRAGPVPDHATGVGEGARIALADGTELHLAAESAVAVELTPERRVVTLIDGAVFAEVAPDPSRPFSVRAGTVEATAIGTAFEVRRVGSVARLAVVEGVVGLTRDDGVEAGRFAAGDWARIDGGDDRVLARGTQSPEAAASWRGGRLSVTDWPVTDVIDVIRDHMTEPVLVLGAEAGAGRVTGVYDLQKPLAALRALAHPHGLTVRPLNDWLVVVSPL